jgi:hypothetical protein
MFMSYLYSKLPETGVLPHIGTGGTDTATRGYYVVYLFHASVPFVHQPRGSQGCKAASWLALSGVQRQFPPTGD